MTHDSQSARLRRHLARRGYVIFRCKDTYPEEQTLHHHDFFEVNLFYSGSPEYSVESRVYRLTPGDILLVSPNELHQPILSGERGGFERMILWIDKAFLQQFTAFGFNPTGCFATARPEHSNCLRFDDESTMQIVALLERCLRENESADFGAEMLADTTMIQILIQINRLALRGGQRTDHSDRSGSLVAGVMDYINDHYAEELTLDALANRFFISKYHLSREFSRLVGTTVHHFIIQKRLVIAKQLLSEGKPSSEVYQSCGFGDYSNFYRAFKNEYGISPKEYVRRVEQDTALNAERRRERSWLIREGDRE